MHDPKHITTGSPTARVDRDGALDVTVWLLNQRGRLEASLERVRGRAARIEAHHSHEARDGMIDPVDRAQLHENDEVVANLGRLADDDIVANEHALDRIAQGTYGQCTSCDASIARARLEALPATTLCSKCAATRANAT